MTPGSTEKSITIEPGLRKIILIELVFPIILLILGIYHGFMQILYRSGIIHGSGFLGLDYYQGLTLHGVVNAVVFTLFFAVAFGHAVIRYYLGRPIDVTAASASLALMLGGTIATAAAILSGTSSVLYTFYPPLRAHPAFYIGLAAAVIGSWVAFFSWIPNYLAWRRENPKKKTPLAVVGILATFIVWVIASTPVAIEIIFQLIPWSMGWVPTVNVPLARLLFWFFGHPLVYFWILPAYVMYYTMLPKLCGGKLFSDPAGRFAFLWFVVFSAPIGIHHQYTDPGISVGYKFLHSFFTMLVALPSFATAFTVAASMEHGGKQKGATGWFEWWSKLPYFDEERWLFPYLFMGLVIFIFGGITGIVNASYTMNLVVHNTSWLPAHFHQTVGGPVFLAFTGMTLFLVTKLTGKEIRLKEWNLWVPYLWTIGIMAFSMGLFIGGVGGEPRRTNMGLTYTNPGSPLYHSHWNYARVLGTLGGTIMSIAAVMFFIVFFTTLFSKAKAAGRLELISSEPLHDEDLPMLQNFRPWLVGSAILLIICYAPPIYETLQAKFPGARPYSPTNPAALDLSSR